MGYTRHNAIIVTSWNKELIELAAHQAIALGLDICPPCKSLCNDYTSFLICPDGSKEGWKESDEGDSKRLEFREWIKKQCYEDGSTSYQWVEIAYNNDDPITIVDSSYTEDLFL